MLTTGAPADPPAWMRPRLETKRLVLRPFRSEDFRWIQGLYEDPEVRKTTLQRARPPWLARILAVLECANPLAWAIEDRETGTPYGTICAGRLPPAPHPAIGFELMRPFWNHGYMTEALESVVRYAFTETTDKALSAVVFVDNRACQRVLEKVGFWKVGPCTCRGFACWMYELRMSDVPEFNSAGG
ncbi:MAG: GNAT family N-acetyltransferase [Acidobacteria bacterium]|nr:GNAT family N-acetyltransferase [Acidobacteriota bacterium]